jgi:NADH-quinone oxidoreductase subunit N
MNIADYAALSPYIILAITSVVIMLGIAFYRDHRLSVLLALAGMALSAGSVFFLSFVPRREIPPLLIVDGYALFYSVLILMAGFAAASLSFSYLEKHEGNREEFYLLLILATLGCIVLAAASHFASFFLGVELLSVSLYALAAYQRHSQRSMEAGVKYLILAAVSSSSILFGMALIYAETGSLKFGEIAIRAASGEVHGLTFLAGIVLIIAGLGFKLALVPFHLWTPDVYEGAPAPVTAFIATASKGAVFALLMRYFSRVDIQSNQSLFVIFTIIAAASMFAGNLLALLQKNVKRLLAYSSISHLGYLLVTLLASGAHAVSAAAFYLMAYFVTTLGTFGVVTVLSGRDRDADNIEDYSGLAWRRPWLAGVFTAMLLSLAGIPLTAGFIGKFFVVAAGAGSALWLLLVVLVINSVIGLYYYLRIIVALYSRLDHEVPAAAALSRSGSVTLTALTLLLLWLGVYPAPVIQLIQKMAQSLIY